MYLVRGLRDRAFIPGVVGGCSVFVLVEIHSDLSLFSPTHTLRTPDLTLFPQTRLPGLDLCQGLKGEGRFRITAHNHHHQPLPSIPSTTRSSHFFFYKGQNTSTSARPNIRIESRERIARTFFLIIIIINCRRFHPTSRFCLFAHLPACLSGHPPAACYLI